MRSAGTRSVTVVTIVTLLFSPLFHHGKQTGEKLVGKTESTVTIKCQPGAPCPAKKTIVTKVMLPASASASARDRDDDRSKEKESDSKKHRD